MASISPRPASGAAVVRLRRLSLVALAAAALVTCTGEPTSPTRPGVGTLRVSPQFDAYARLVPLTLDNVRVIVVRPPSTVILTATRSFTPGTQQLTLSLPVLLQSTSEALQVTLELYAGTTLLFSGTSTVQVAAGGTTAPASVPVVYQGPGATLTTLTLAPRDTTVSLGASFPFTATAQDAQQANVPQFYVSWSADNGGIDAAGGFTAPGARDTVMVHAVTPNGVEDSTRVIVTAAPSTLTKVGGDGQSGIVGTRLPQPLAVQVNGSDGLPVPGASVAFTVTTGGGSVDSAVATSDAQGIARSGAVLGPTVGAQSFTATVSGIPAAVFTATATGVAPIVVTLAAGGNHTCEIRGAQTLCWGDNSTGQLGDGTTADRAVPGPVATAQTFVSLALGDGHTCALTAAGQAFCWGENFSGSLGNGTTNASSTPVAVSGGRTFVALTAGEEFTCGLTAGGQAFCWGYNFDGQLGDGGTSDQLVPVPVSGGLSFTSLDAGTDHTCALTAAGQAFCWGSNFDGQLGDGTLVSQNVPTAVTGGLSFSAIHAGFNFSCGLTTGGAGFCWGINFGLQLTSPQPVAGGFTYTAIAGGDNHLCGLTTGGWRCGGDNGSGQLGDGTTTDRVSPVLPSGGFTFTALAGGAQHTCARTSSGTRCWGSNTVGQLGDGTNTNQLTPTSTVGPATTAAVSAGNGQTASAGTAVPSAPAIVVRDALNVPVPGLTVTFGVTSGGGAVTGAVTQTDALGVATVGSWTLGATPGSNTLSATVQVGGVSGNPVSFTATGTAPSVVTWNGSVSTAWTTAANWTPAVVPTSAQDVVIPSGTPNQPTVTSTANTQSLTIQSGATLTLSGSFTFNVFGDFANAGTITLAAGTPTLDLRGTTRTMRGNTPVATSVSGSYTLTGAVTVANSLSISGGTASLTVGGQFLTVNTLTVGSGGSLVETNPSDYVQVNGNVTMGGSDHTGKLTAGNLSVQGNFLQSSSGSPNSFAATGTHTTSLIGPGTVSFQSPGTAASRFQDLVVVDPLVAGNPVTLLSRVVAGRDVVVATAGLTLNGHTLEVGRNFDMLNDGTRLTMTNVLDSLLVAGNATFDGEDELTFMSAGVLVVGGNLSQFNTRSNDSFHPSGTHKTVLTGANPTLSFATPGLIPGSSHFQLLDWTGTGTLTLASDVFAHGTFQSLGAGASTIAGINQVLDVGGLSAAGPLTFNGTALRLNMASGGPLALGNLTFQNMSSTVNQLEVLHPGTGGPFTFTNFSFSSVPSTGRYLQITDTDGATPDALTIDMVSPTPGTDGGFSQALNGAVINWPAAVPGVVTWNGSVSTSWNTAANWTPAQVPGPLDSVVIPNTGAANNPTFSGQGTVAAIFQDGRLTINGGTLQVSRSVTGAAVLNRVTQLTLPTDSLIIADSLNGNVVGSGSVIGGGGVLVVGGSIGQPLGSVFLTVVLDGTGTQTWVQGTSGQGGVLLVRKPSGNVVFPSGVRMDSIDVSTAIPLSGTTLVSDRGLFTAGSLTFSSLTVQGPFAVLGAYVVNATTIAPATGVAAIAVPVLPYQTLTIDGTAGATTLSLAGRTTVTGNLNLGGVNRAILDLNGQTLEVSGNLLTNGLGGSFLRMLNPLDSLLVAGNADFSSATPNNPGNMTAGTFVLGGNFTQTNPFGGAPFQATGTHLTVLTATSPTASFVTPGTGTNQNRFANLTWTGTGTFTLASGITVSGAFTTTAATPVTLFGNIASSRFLQFATISAAGSLVFDQVRVIVTQAGTRSAVGLGNATFQNMANDIAQLTIQHPGVSGGSVSLSNLTFASVPVTGFYVSASDNNTSDGIPLVVDLSNPNPATDGGFKQELGGATINWPASAPVKTWTGASSNNWANPGNWSPSGAPTATEDAVIPAGMPNNPTAFTNAQMRNLTVASGALLTVSGGLFVVNGDLDAQGPITVDPINAGMFLDGAGKTMRGSVTDVSVRGSYTLNGVVVLSNDLIIRGTLAVGGQTVSIAGDLLLLSAGQLIMQNPADVVAVGGNTFFTGGSTAGLMTEGALELHGNLTQANSGTGFPANSFSPSGNHRTFLAGSNVQQVDIFNTGLGSGASHFANLDLSLKTGGSVNLVRFNTVFVEGQFISQPPGAPPTIGTSNGAQLSVAGVDVDGLVVNNLPLAIGAGPLAQFDKVTFQGMSSTATQLTLNHPGQPGAFVCDLLSFTSTPTTGGLYLQANDTDGASPDALTINLTNPTPATDGGFSSALNGAVINWPGTGPAIQWTGATSTDWFTASNWSGGVVPTGTDNVIIPAGPVNPPTLTTNGSVNDLTVQAGAPAIDVGDFALVVAGNLDNGFQIGSSTGNGGLTLVGAGKLVRGNFVNATILVAGSYALNGRLFLVAGGNLSVSGSGALFLNGNTAQVTGSFSTGGTGLVVMTNALDSLVVSGAAVFAGGNANGTMTSGVLRLSGDLIQAGGDPSAFFASGSHKTLLEGSLPATVQFLNPGSSQFQDVEFANSSVSLAGGVLVAGNAQVTAGELALGGTTFTVGGDFSTAGTGTLRMDQSLDNLQVGGDATFGGGDGTGLVTDGLIQVGGNFTQGGTAAAPAFVGSGSNIVRLTGGTTTVSTVGSNATTVFNSLEVATSGPVTLNNTSSSLNLDGTGSLSVLTPVSVTYASAGPAILAFDGGTTTVAGSALSGPAVSLAPGTAIQGTYNVVNTTWDQRSAPQLQVPSSLPYQNLIFRGTNLFLDPGTFSVPGDLTLQVPNAGTVRVHDTLGTRTLLDVSGTTQVFGRLLLEGGRLTTGTLDVATLGGSRGFLSMLGATDSVLVAGDAAFGGGSTNGLLTAGVLQIGGNLSQTTGSSVASFAPSGTHKTRFSSGATQTVSLASPGTGAAGSHFQVLDLTSATGGVSLLTSNTAADSVISTSAAVKLTGGGRSLTMRRAQISGLISDNAPLVLDEQGVFSTENLSNITFQGFPTTGQLLLSITGPGGSVTARPAVTTTNMTFPSLGIGAGNLYVKLTSSNGLTFNLTMAGSNQSPQIGGNGPALSDPANQTTVNGATILWP